MYKLKLKIKLKMISYAIIFSMLIQVPIPIVFNFKTYAATTNDDIYDVILFWGQSNMVGSCYPRKESELRFNPEDSTEVKNYSKISGISEDILSKNSKTAMNIVFIPQKSKTVYEYVYTKDSIKEITEETTQYGEHLIYNISNENLEIPQNNSIRSLSASKGTNIIPEFCRTYYEKTGHKVVAVLAAREGKPIRQFLPYNDKDNTVSDNEKELRLYESIKEKYNKAINYLNRNNYKIGTKMYVAFQGEADVGNTIETTNTNYYNQFMKVHNYLKKDLGIQKGAIVETARASGTYRLDAVNIIHQALERLIGNSDIILGSTFSYDKYVPIESDYNNCNTKITFDSNGNKISYQNALEKARMAEDYINEESRNNAVHLTSAALSQVGRETAQNLAKTIDKTIPQITKVTATDGYKTVTNVYSNNKLSGSNNIGNTWFKNNVTLKFEATDNNGIKSYWISGTKSQSKIISSTTNGVKLTVYDYADNEAIVTVNVKIDKTSPTIKTPKQILSSDKQSVNLTVPAEDSQSGISQYSFDGGKTWQKGNQYKYTSNQTINAGTIKVKDVAGNIGTYNTKVTISGIDKTIPQITKVIATDGSKTVTNVYSNNKLSGSNNIGNTWFKNNVTLKFEATDNNGIKSYWISGTKGQSRIISETTNGIKLTVYDNADNEAYVTVNIKIDKDAPKIVGNITKSSNVKYVKSVIITIPKIEDVGKAGLRGDKKSYSYDSGKTWVASNSTTYTTNGNKPIWIRDSVDNILKTTVNIDNVDSEVPKITSVTGYTNGIKNEKE